MNAVLVVVMRHSFRGTSRQVAIDIFWIIPLFDDNNKFGPANSLKFDEINLANINKRPATAKRRAILIHFYLA